MTEPKHYQQFPCMRPWEGHKYMSPIHNRLLVIGESYYLPATTEINQDPSTWYGSNQEQLSTKLKDNGGTDRTAVSPYMLMTFFREEDHNKGNSMGMYHVFTKAMNNLLLHYPRYRDAVDDLAFYNYFQRPAVGDGESIEPYAIDEKVAGEVFDWNVDRLNPNIILFMSTKAGRTFEKVFRRVKNLRERGIHYAISVNSGSFMYKPIPNRGNMSGEDICGKAIKEYWLKH